MHLSQLKLTVGSRLKNRCGQWIESTISLRQEGCFVFRADLCRRAPNEDFLLFRLEEEIDLPLTAELVLGLLLLVAEPPFRPSEPGLSISITGESPSANRAAIRMLDPEIRATSRYDYVPRQVREFISKKMSYLVKYRKKHGLILTPGSFE